MFDLELLALDVKHMVAAGYAFAVGIPLVAGKAVGELTAIIAGVARRFAASPE